jgi:hypothetical protein
MTIRKMLLFLPMLFITTLHAHCPLCTVGAAAAAGGAKVLGVNSAVVGLFVGGFALSTGWFLSKKLNKNYIPLQHPIILAFAFFSTIIPLLPLLGGEYGAFSIFMFGDYGSFFNTTHIFDLFIVGSLVGGIIVSAMPSISRRICEIRGNRIFPYQGILLTFVSLVIVGLVMQYAIVWS